MANNKLAQVGSNAGIFKVLLSEPIDDYNGVSFTEKGKQALLRTALNVRAGLVTIAPLICKGPKVCPFKDRCPLFIADGYDGGFPVNKQCIVEATLARNMLRERIEEFELDIEEVEASPTIRSLLSKLVELDIYDYRQSLVLAGVSGDIRDALLLKEQSVAIIPEKDIAVSQLQEHPSWRNKAMIQRQRMEILNALVATPKEKVKKQQALKEKKDDDYLSRIKQLQEKLNKVLDLWETSKVIDGE